MIASLGVVPAAGLASSVQDSMGAHEPALVAESLLGGYLWQLEPWIGDASVLRPMAMSSDGPVELLLSLEGRSLAAEQAHRISQGLAPLDADGQRAFVASVRQGQEATRSAIVDAGARVLYEYQRVLNGFAVSIDRAHLWKISSVSGVARIERAQVYEIALQESVPFILGGETNAALGADGTGITIAVIDTGIDYTHIGLGGSGVVADYTGNDATTIEPGTFPTEKVVGGTDLVGEFYDARGFNAATRPSCTNVPVPDHDPLDVNGHGSHVSGIAAGTGLGGVPQGVAPAASLLGIKIFSGCALDGTASTSTTNIIAALEVAVDPNGDGDTSDAADVINMSLGGAFGRDTELTAVASNAAVDLGAIVVASAGNSGNIPYITGAPAAASKAISVAAGNDPGFGIQLVNVAASASADGDYQSVEAAFTPPLEVTGAKSGIAVRLGDPGTPAVQLCSPLGEGALAGKVPLIQRGACTFQIKITNAENAGAIAAVVYNNAGGAPVVMGGTAAGIPAVMVSLADGTAISGAIDTDTTFTLDPGRFIPLTNLLQSFTSRGPRFGDATLKPDVTAPGARIFSVDVGTGSGGISLSGTSMSSPHVAGAAALLRELHPTWTVEEIKALLMNTATNAEPTPGLPYPVSLMGAGRVQANVAADSESVVIPGSVSFGVEERADIGLRILSALLDLRNKGPSSKTFSLTSSLSFASDREGSVFTFHPTLLTVGAGGTKKIQFSVLVSFPALRPEAQFEEYDGFLEFTEITGGGDVLRVPFHLVPIARANARAIDDNVVLPGDSTFTIANMGTRATNVDLYQLGVRDDNEDLIFEGPGMPNDPDDWFDVRYTGAHSFPGFGSTVIEFAVNVYDRRSAPSMVETDIYVDVNGGDPDFVAIVGDDAIFGLAPSFTGRIVSAVFALPGGPGTLQFIVNNDRNQGWQTVPILLSALNALPGPDLTAADPDFDYFVATFDLETGSFDVTDAENFNVFTPARSASPRFFSVAAGGSVVVTVFGSGPGDVLALFLNNAAGRSQGQRIGVTGP